MATSRRSGKRGSGRDAVLEGLVERLATTAQLPHTINGFFWRGRGKTRGNTLTKRSLLRIARAKYKCAFVHGRMTKRQIVASTVLQRLVTRLSTQRLQTLQSSNWQNDVCPFTLEPLSETNNVFVRKSASGYRRGFSLDSLVQWIISTGEARDPCDKELFSARDVWLLDTMVSRHNIDVPYSVEHACSRKRREELRQARVVEEQKQVAEALLKEDVTEMCRLVRLQRTARDPAVVEATATCLSDTFFCFDQHVHDYLHIPGTDHQSLLEVIRSFDSHVNTLLSCPRLRSKVFMYIMILLDYHLHPQANPAGFAFSLPPNPPHTSPRDPPSRTDTPPRDPDDRDLAQSTNRDHSPRSPPGPEDGVGVQAGGERGDDAGAASGVADYIQVGQVGPPGGPVVRTRVVAALDPIPNVLSELFGLPIVLGGTYDLETTEIVFDDEEFHSESASDHDSESEESERVDDTNALP